MPTPVGVLLVASAAGALVYGVVESDTYGWTSLRPAIALLGGLTLLGLFVAHQRQTGSPTLDLDLFRLGNFRWDNLGMLACSAAFSSVFFGLILFLVEVWEWSILWARFGLAGQIGQRPLVIAGGRGRNFGSVSS